MSHFPWHLKFYFLWNVNVCLRCIHFLQLECIAFLSFSQATTVIISQVFYLLYFALNNISSSSVPPSFQTFLRSCIFPISPYSPPLLTLSHPSTPSIMTTLLSPTPTWSRHPAWPLPEIILIMPKCVRRPGMSFHPRPLVSFNLSPAALQGYWGQLSVAVCAEGKCIHSIHVRHLRLLVVKLHWFWQGLSECLSLFLHWSSFDLRHCFV